MRLIDADALKKAFEDCTCDCACCIHNTNDFEYCGLIDDAPTVERPKGEWKLDSVGVYCSECKLHPDYSTNFCPFCGADMRGKEND